MGKISVHVYTRLQRSVGVFIGRWGNPYIFKYRRGRIRKKFPMSWWHFLKYIKESTDDVALASDSKRFSRFTGGYVR